MLLWNFENVLLDKVFIFLSTLSITFPFYSISTDLSVLCLLHNAWIQLLIHSVIVDVAFSHKILLVSFYIGPSVTSSIYYFQRSESPHLCVGGLFYKIRACTVTWQNGIILKKTLTSRLETSLIKLIIFGLIGLVSDNKAVGSSNFIPIIKHAFTDRSWKIWVTLMNLTLLFKEKNLTNISSYSSFNFRYRWFEYLRLNSIVSRTREHHWKYIEILSLSWRCIKIYYAVFLRLYFLLAKIDTRQKLGTSDKLWMRWCFSLMRNSPGEKELLFLWIIPREALSFFLVKGGNLSPTSTWASSFLY